MARRTEESESRTRRERIDPGLRAAGWTVAPFRPGIDISRSRHHALTEYPTANGPADDALFVDGQLLGIVEAKKLTLGSQNVLTQAERYSKGVLDGPIDLRGYRVPFLYSTNGESIWFHDVRHELIRSRRIARFHTPSALREAFGRDFAGACGWFTTHPNGHPRLRPYQVEANAAIERRVGAASARADKLTQAIPAKAFRGELVPTEAELNRRRDATNATPPPATRRIAAQPAPRRPR